MTILFIILIHDHALRVVFSLILNMIGKIDFQTGKAILLHVEFSRIPSNFKR